MMWWAYCLIGWALWTVACLEWLWHAVENAPIEQFPGEFGIPD